MLLIDRLSFVLVPTVLAMFAVSWTSKFIQSTLDNPGILTLLEEEADLVEVARGKDRVVMTESALGTAEAALRCHPVLAWHAGLLHAWLLLPHY